MDKLIGYDVKKEQQRVKIFAKTESGWGYRLRLVSASYCQV